jgi:hypothetical protein
MMNSGSGNFDELEKTLKQLDTVQVGTLVRFLSSWNTNAKNYFPAQVCVHGNPWTTDVKTEKKLASLETTFVPIDSP